MTLIPKTGTGTFIGKNEWFLKNQGLPYLLGLILSVLDAQGMI